MAWRKAFFLSFHEVGFLPLDLLPAVRVVRTIEGTRCSFFLENGGAYGASLLDLLGQVAHGLCLGCSA